MTEGEIVEAAFAAHGMANNALVFYLSTVTAYLAAAHLIGAELTKFQSRTITTMFVVLAGFSTWGVVGYFYLGHGLTAKSEILMELSTEKNLPIYLFIGPVLVAGILAALKYMHDIRRSK